MASRWLVDMLNKADQQANLWSADLPTDKSRDEIVEEIKYIEDLNNEMFFGSESNVKNTFDAIFGKTKTIPNDIIITIFDGEARRARLALMINQGGRLPESVPTMSECFYSLTASIGFFAYFNMAPTKNMSYLSDELGRRLVLSIGAIGIKNINLSREERMDRAARAETEKIYFSDEGEIIFGASINSVAKAVDPERDVRKTVREWRQRDEYIRRIMSMLREKDN